MNAMSRFLKTRTFKRNGVLQFAEWRPIAIRSTVSQEYIVTTADVNRPDWIAHQTLGSSDLWWVILQFNGLPDGMGLVAGDKLAIPPLSVVNAALLKAANEVKITYPEDMQEAFPVAVTNLPLSRVPKLTEFLRLDETGLTSNANVAFNLGFEIPDVSDVLHFQLQLSGDDTFTDVQFSAFTLQTTEKWYYYNPTVGDAGSFVTFPESGVNAALYNGQTCYYSFYSYDLSSGKQYWPRWRYFNSAGTDSAWFVPPPFIAP